MPTYEYQCPDCGHEFEEFQSITAKPIRTCPKCKKRKVKRLIGSGGGVIFKGSGFYETDYVKKPGGGDKSKSSSDSDSSGKDSSGEKSASDGSSDNAKPSSNDKSSSDSATKPKK